MSLLALLNEFPGFASEGILEEMLRLITDGEEIDSQNAVCSVICELYN